ncbi:MAG: hypothetical protein DRN27_06660 [Thermoplasmata archaeon]|nr:MAG: hypothetical protein DRN27_06660 [Thermoplasmata archaeon]
MKKNNMKRTILVMGVITILLLSSIPSFILADENTQSRTIYVDDDNTSDPRGKTEERTFQYMENEFLDLMGCIDGVSDALQYNNGARGWGWWWPDFPGRFEPFFDIDYEVDELLTKDMDDMNGMASADFNDDGLLDFAVSWAEILSTTIIAHISIFYNNGGENDFTAVKVFSLDLLGMRIQDLDAADYDNDGDIDLLCTYSEHAWHNDLPFKINGTGKILLNDGQNNFDDGHMAFWHGPGDPKDRDHNRINPQISSADFDGDGDIDFVVGDNTGLVAFHKNDGTGNFTWVCDSDFGYEKGLSWGITSADFNGDGYIDFIVTEFDSHEEGDVYLKYNDGTDSCFNHSDYSMIANIPDYDNQSFYVCINYAAQGCLSAIDYNDDGLMDFLFGGMGYVLLYVQTIDGVFEHFTVCRLPAPNPNGDGAFIIDNLRLGGIAIGDFNNDGLDDAIMGGSNYIIETLYNNCNLVDITFPDRSCKIINNEIIAGFLPFYPILKHGTSIVQGDVTVITKELEPLSKVKFYLDNKLVHTDDDSPFEWEWSRFSFGRHKVKAVAYDLDGNEAGFDDTIVWKFL